MHPRKQPSPPTAPNLFQRNPFSKAENPTHTLQIRQSPSWHLLAIPLKHCSLHVSLFHSCTLPAADHYPLLNQHHLCSYNTWGLPHCPLPAAPSTSGKALSIPPFHKRPISPLFLSFLLQPVIGTNDSPHI